MTETSAPSGDQRASMPNQYVATAGAYERLRLLQTYNTIAMVGLSGDPMRPSHFAAIYMQSEGYDIVIMSDLLHFDASHDVLLSSLLSLLRKSPESRAYVAAGKYTKAHHCDHFVNEAKKTGILLEEEKDEPIWRGTLDVHGGGLDREQLGVRKGMCRWWVGRWQ